MEGADIIGTLLRDAVPVTQRVPAPQIRLGMLAEDAPLPSLLIRSISTVERLKLQRIGRVRVSERVAVTVRAASYRDQVAIMKLLPPACAGKTGSFGGATGVSVVNGGTSPDVIGPGKSFEQTIDFRVSYEIAA